MKAIKSLAIVAIALAVLSIFVSQSGTQAATDTRDAKIIFSTTATSDTHDALLVTIQPAYVSDNTPVLHRLNDCVPYARSMTTFTGGYSHNVILRHGNCEPAPVTKKSTKTVKNTVNIPTITETTETTETPVIVPVVPVDDKPETPADTCANANPGNTKCVGKAGENPNGKDTMPLDNAGGNGNGEHGNQGQGGNSDHSN